MGIEKIIKAAVERGASDLHIKAGDVFRARIDGQLVPLTKQPLTPDQTKSIAMRLIASEEDRARIDLLTDYDCSWGAPGIGRFRVNILRQRSSFMIVMRVIPFEVPTLEALGLPPAVARIARVEPGMVLVTGLPGSGTSSTIAAIVHEINTRENRHIVTLEHPIEFLHRDVQSSVTQREVGVDTESFAVGLKAALRQDPDVIVLGEMRDPETIATAMKAAEMGHLLLSTLESSDAVGTIERLLAPFPPEEQGTVRTRLAGALRAIISQRLLPRADGAGRVAAAEVLVASPEIRDLIVDGGDMRTLRDRMAAGWKEHEMQTLDQHLEELATTGVIAADVAVANAACPEALAARLRSRRGTSGGAGGGRLPDGRGGAEVAGRSAAGADERLR